MPGKDAGSKPMGQIFEYTNIHPLFGSQKSIDFFAQLHLMINIVEHYNRESDGIANNRAVGGMRFWRACVALVANKLFSSKGRVDNLLGGFSCVEVVLSFASQLY